MCLDDPILIRLIARELPDDQRRAAEAHLSACALCQARCDELRATWDILGQWEVPPPADSLAPAVLQMAHRSRWAFAPLRAAAAILVAFGVGALAAALFPRQQAPVAAQVVADEQLVQALGLDQLGAPSPLGEVFAESNQEEP